MESNDLRGSLTVSNSPTCLSHIRRFMQSVCARVGARQGVTEEIILAVGEAASNAVRHGWRNPDDQIVVRYACKDLMMVIEVADNGQGFDPKAVKEGRPECLEAGCLGILIMKRLMDKVEFESGPEGTVVRLIKNIK